MTFFTKDIDKHKKSDYNSTRFYKDFLNYGGNPMNFKPLGERGLVERLGVL